MNIPSIPSDFAPDYSEALFSSTKSKSIVTDDKTMAEAIIFQKLGMNVSMVPFEKRWYHKLFYDDDFSKFWQHQRSDGSLLIVDLNNQKIIYKNNLLRIRAFINDTKEIDSLIAEAADKIQSDKIVSKILTLFGWTFLCLAWVWLIFLSDKDISIGVSFLAMLPGAIIPALASVEWFYSNKAIRFKDSLNL